MITRYYIFYRGKGVFSLDRGVLQPFVQSDAARLISSAGAHNPIQLAVDKTSAALEYPGDRPLPEGYDAVSLRTMVGTIEEEDFCRWSRASQLLHWYRTTRFCGSCGQETEQHRTELAKQCQSCGTLAYPAISPCIIVLVHRPGKILLARSPRFPAAMYSTLAGFIEPGESAEETLHREVFEETGIEVHNLCYYGSQPWPFPGQLMLGFFAEYKSGSIQIDNEEIVDANWYPLDRLPQIPGPATIAGRLIRHHLELHAITYRPDVSV